MAEQSVRIPTRKPPEVLFKERVQGFVCDLAVYRAYFDPKAEYVPTKLTREGLEKKAAENPEQKRPLPPDFDFANMIAAGPRAYQLLVACREHLEGKNNPPLPQVEPPEQAVVAEAGEGEAKKKRKKKNPHGLVTDERLEIVLKALPMWRGHLKVDPEREFRCRAENLKMHTTHYQNLFDGDAQHIPARLTVDRLKKRARVALSPKFDYGSVIRAGDRTCELASGYQKDLEAAKLEEKGKEDPERAMRIRIVEQTFPHWKDLYGKTNLERFKAKVDRLAAQLADYRDIFDPEADIISYGTTVDVLTRKATKNGKELGPKFNFQQVIDAGSDMADILRGCRAVETGDTRRTAGMTREMVDYAYEKLPGIRARALQTKAAGAGGERGGEAHYYRPMDLSGDKLEARSRTAFPARKQLVI